MPQDMIQQYLMYNTRPNHKKFRMIIQTAPFLKGMKESCILIMKAGELEELGAEFQKTNIKMRLLYEGNGRSIVLFYRRAVLEAYLSRVDVRQCLYRYGYQGTCLADYMEHLKNRVSFFHEEQQTFPHEIGVFLGYPVEDVEGFIENSGKNFLMSGYWKVYSNLQSAKEMFEKFDRAKVQALKQWSNGESLCEIACRK